MRAAVLVVVDVVTPRFLLVLAGQTGALFGAGLTAFALGLWSLQHDGDVQRFALLAAAATLPGVLLAPLAGILAERASPRRSLLFANGAAVVSTLALLQGVRLHLEPGPWMLACLVVGGVGFGLQWPVYAKALVRLLDATVVTAVRDRDRAAALLQLGPVAQHVAAPAVAALCVARLGIEQVLVLDVILGVLAMASSLGLPDTADADDGAAHGLGEAISFLRARFSLVRLQVFFFCSYVFGAVLQALSTPLLLSLVAADEAGVLLSLSGIGMIAGVGVATVVGVRRRIRGVVLLEAFGGVCLIGMGVWPTPWAILACASLFLLQMSWSNALSQAAWQSAVPGRLQVRVFALRRMIAWAAFPLCFVVAGPAADIAIDHADDRTAGIAFVFIVAGVGKLLVSIIARARHLLDDLDDLDDPAIVTASPSQP